MTLERDFGNSLSWFPLNDVHILYHNVSVENTAGKSKLDVLCQDQSDSYLWIRHKTSRQTNLNARDNLFAHEVAHMLGMRHIEPANCPPACVGPGLMSKNDTNAIAQWSSTTQSDKFDRYLDDYGNCTRDN